MKTGLSSVDTTRVHGPCSRPVNTGVKNDTRLHGPCLRPVNTAVHTGSVYRTVVTQLTMGQ